MALPLLTSLFAFLALTLLALWAIRGAGRPAEARIKELSVVRQQGTGLAAIPFRRRAVSPLIDGMGRLVASILPGRFLGRTERRLVLAGNPMRPAAFYAMVLVMGVGVALLYLLLLVAGTSGTPSPIAVLASVFFAVVGAYLPIFWLSSQAKGRQREMLNGLPDSLDLLTVCVEAGLGLDAAFQRVTEKQSGPFVDEIRQMLREIGLGKTRKQALTDLADRVDSDDVRGFVSAIIQAEQLGTSIGQVLRVQSQRLRVRRRQRAEAEARRAPVKIVFPLVFCFMPSLFIIILGPMVIGLVDYLSN
jgi:tight adherence protein C